jgi:hypothetical protein
MFGSSMLMTVGHALDRAKDEGLVVRVNAGGEWISGRIVNSDGHGVALLESNGDLCVLRSDSITGVRMPQSPASRPARADRTDAWVPENRVPAQSGDLELV